MGRIGLEKLVANLRDVFSINTHSFTLCCNAALVVHGIIKEVEKPVLLVDKATIENISAQRGIVLNSIAHAVYGNVQTIVFGDTLIITPVRMPKYHVTEDIGPFKVETISTVIMNMLIDDMVEHKDKIEKCFENGGTLRLEAWSYDLELIETHYSAYPDYYEVLEDPDGSEVLWKTLNGIETAKDDYIFLEYIGMMYMVED